MSPKRRADGGGKPPLTPAGSVGAMVRAARLARRMTLQRLADEVGCAKSYLWLIERERRENPPSDWMIAKLERALALEGRLLSAARWQETPGEVRREVSALKAKEQAATRLAEILKTRAGAKAGLDAVYRSGELRRLIEAIGGEQRDSETGRERDSETARQRDRGGQSSKLKAQSSNEGEGPLALALEVPLINRVAAGYPREFTDLGYPVRAADEYVRCPDLEDPDAFAARVVGDSMLPEYREGDIVVFSPARTITSGMDCFVRIEPDHESTFKRVYFEESSKRKAQISKGGGEEEEKQMIRLQPLNPAYPARVLAREQVAGLYAAVSVMRKIG